MTKVIGVTGGVGAGKTTILRVLRKQGIEVITADEVGRQVTKKGSPVLRALTSTFGKTVLNPEGELDRKKVGYWVFQNPQALQRLNHLTHPQMRRIINAVVRERKKRGVKAIGVEAAVLFEMGLHRFVDEVWVVTASSRERLKRMERAGWKREIVWRRMIRQLPDEMFRRRAHRVIVTDDGKLSTAAIKVN
ncbi:MAG: dephospho-CoA kinase [Armatimonadetes bacterium]|nr:dephospho-CoA kinase [Armatimonadota bacterium]MCX7968122.1 dephospho-CoA kinase [Armatimonadota bacterium]MDW8143140.1 dephospho-CoA kinase [Armatimonadota bacterium]